MADKEEDTKHLPEDAAPDDATEKKTDKAEQSSIEEAPVRKFVPHGAKQWLLSHKKISIPAAIVLALAIVFAVPLTRYSVLGLFLQQSFPVVVVDAQTGRPVSAASVDLAGKSVSTDGQGRASLKVSVGSAALLVSKQYYTPVSKNVLVPATKPAKAYMVKLQATGRAVPVTVHNSITGKPIAGASIVAGQSKAKTDDKGQAVLVVPSGQQQLVGSLSGDGFNKIDITVKVTSQEDVANNFKLTPSGKVYFLSNQTGTLDVVKADLDGKGRQTVLAGTGKEVKHETVLLATRDWGYLALFSRRDGGSPKLFLIKTADDSLTVMDEGDAEFNLTGWEGHRFVYTVTRTKLNEWEAKKQALKAYDADAKKLTTLDQTVAEGGNQYDYLREFYGTVHAFDGRAVYTKGWQGGYNTWYTGVPNKQPSLYSVKLDGSDKKTVKAFSAASGTQASSLSVQTQPYKPSELYVQWQDKFFEYEDGKLKDLPNMTTDAFYAGYATYLASPSGKQVFWSEERDGKLTFLLGDADAENESKVASLETTYRTYGWYTDSYLLISKNGSELYIMPATGVQSQADLLKVTDYFRPAYSYPGYGGGYGGL